MHHKILLFVTFIALVLPPAVVAAQETTPAPQAALPSATLAEGVTLQLTGLKRFGDVVILKYTVKNESKYRFPLSPLLNEANEARMVRLLDNPEKKAYLPMEDGEQRCICSRGTAQMILESGKAQNFWAQFSAPKSKQVMVAFSGGAIFEDVPVDD